MKKTDDEVPRKVLLKNSGLVIWFNYFYNLCTLHLTDTFSVKYSSIIKKCPLIEKFVFKS